MAEALALLDPVARPQSLGSAESSSMLRLGEVYLLAGRLEDTRHRAAHAIARVRDRKERGNQWQAAPNLANHCRGSEVRY
jgi:hypothetical protein